MHIEHMTGAGDTPHADIVKWSLGCSRGLNLISLSLGVRKVLGGFKFHIIEEKVLAGAIGLASVILTMRRRSPDDCETRNE
jgi:hypothetical protein